MHDQRASTVRLQYQVSLILPCYLASLVLNPTMSTLYLTRIAVLHRARTHSSGGGGGGISIVLQCCSTNMEVHPYCTVDPCAVYLRTRAHQDKAGMQKQISKIKTSKFLIDLPRDRQ